MAKRAIRSTGTSSTATVIDVTETSPSHRLLPAIVAGLTAAPKILLTAAGYQRRILQGRAWFRSGWMVADAVGNGSVRRVAVAPVDEDGRPSRTREAWHEIDTLMVGYGLLPSAECVRMMECSIRVNLALNRLVPIRSETLETSIGGVYAVGDGAGIGGVEVALLEGRIAAHAILGRSPTPALMRRYARLDRFRRQLNLAYITHRRLRAAGPETLVCHCEELSLYELIADPARHRSDIDRLKRSRRIGMGHCQGRICLPTLAGLLDLPVDAYRSYPRARRPLRPVQFRHLAADAGPPNEPDEALTNLRDVT